MVNFPVIYLNPAHSPCSPGGVFGGRTEHGDSEKLCRALLGELLKADGTLNVKITKESKDFSEMRENDLLFVFHRGTAPKQSPVNGAEIYVKENAASDIQYEAFRLLRSLCGKNGFRYRRVHTLTAKSPFVSFGKSVPERAYLIKTGYIDNDRDNEVFDREFPDCARSLAGEILRILKERKYENNS